MGNPGCGPSLILEELRDDKLEQKGYGWLVLTPG